MPLDGTDYEAPAISDADRQAAAILRRARAVIADELHWCQNASSRSTTYGVSYCMMGAVAAAGGTSVEPSVLYGPVSVYAALEKGIGYTRSCGSATRIPKWNDSPRRTHAEVLAAFDRAIALCEGK